MHLLLCSRELAVHTLSLSKVEEAVIIFLATWDDEWINSHIFGKTKEKAICPLLIQFRLCSFLWLNTPPLCMYTTISLFTYALICCFHTLNIINNDAMSIGVHVSSYLFKLVFLFSSNKHSEVELLDHMVGNRWGNSGNSVRYDIFGLQNHFRWWLQPWN